MSARSRRTLFLLLLIFPAIAFSQQWPSTLLWRISGKGLSKPSYLYGTMHLQDKRLFNFGDSLYRSIENTEGFAMEVDFSEYLDTLLGNMIEKAEQKMLADESANEKVELKKLSPSADSLLKKMGLSKSKLTRKDLKKIRDYRIRSFLAKGEMQTIVDAYLYGIALRQGKWVGGIEDVHDQMDIMDEIGGDVDEKEVFQPEEKLKTSMEAMMRIYMAQDLKSIEQYSYHGSSQDYVDKVLINRNIKMARRMDSLMQFRSMFFAVGAAHLPGDSGVIRFLRSRGFDVEPVFSSRNIPAEDYVQDMQRSWFRVEDDEHAYAVDMPGKPSEYKMFGELVKMKMFLDITTLTVYISGQTISNVKETRDFEKVFEAMANQRGAGTGHVISKKLITQKGLPGMEAQIENADGYYRVQLLQRQSIMYMLVAGSNKKDNVLRPDVDRFYNSFVPGETVKKDWVKFSLPAKGFTVMLPGSPRRNKSFERQPENDHWKYTAYDYADATTGAYYMMMIRDIGPGYYLQGDSSLFAQLKTGLSDKMVKLLRDQFISWQGYRGLRYDGKARDFDVVYRTLSVVRGNRVYSLMTVANPKMDTTELENFLNSFSLTGLEPMPWKNFHVEKGGFETKLPAAMVQVTPESDTGEDEIGKTHFISYDSSRVISYQVLKKVYSPYFWAVNDSSYFRKKLQEYTASSDELLFRKRTRNGALNGMEVALATNDRNVKHIRVFFNGDTLYTLLAYVPSVYDSLGEYRQFFDSFRMDHEMETTVFHPKAEALLEALKTKDSATFLSLRGLLSEVEFSKEDLPLLHKALLEKYERFQNSGYNGVSWRLRNILQKLGDESTLDFINAHYKELTGEREVLKYEWLQLLASFKTKKAFTIFKSYSINDLPARGDAYALTQYMKDSLELSLSLFPEILNSARDSIFRELLVPVVNEMLDSNKIGMAMLMPYRNILLEGARHNLLAVKDSSGKWWNGQEWIALIARFNDAAANTLLRNYIKSPQGEIKESAVIALLKNGQPVPATVIESLAADNRLRIGLYEDLRSIKKPALFPIAYKNQKRLAESELYQLATGDDDDEVSSIEFIGEKTADYKGGKQSFLLFKVKMAGGEDKQTYLGVAGPYKAGSREVLTGTEATGIYWTDPFNATGVAAQLRKYLQGLLEDKEE